jgi:hypothetical protein
MGHESQVVSCHRSRRERRWAFHRCTIRDGWRGNGRFDINQAGSQDTVFGIEPKDASIESWMDPIKTDLLEAFHAIPLDS